MKMQKIVFRAYLRKMDRFTSN